MRLRPILVNSDLRGRTEESGDIRLQGAHLSRHPMRGSVDARQAMVRFRAMNCSRAGKSRVLALLLTLTSSWGVGCDKPAPARSNDTASPIVPPPPTPESTIVSTEAPWDSAAGPVFLVVGDAGSRGSVIFPSLPSDASLDTARLDVSAYRGAQFDLLSNGKVVAKASLATAVANDPPDDCTAWPSVQLTGGSDSLARGWVVAFQSGRVVPIVFDSLAGLPSRDSSQLAIEIARLASASPGDSVAELKGLPYQVRHAYRFSLAPGTEGILAEVLRSLNQEANPKQEHLLLLAERDSASNGQFITAFSERTSGGEETLETTELLTIARLGSTGRLTAVIARYVGDGVMYSLLERRRPRSWRLRWTSPYAGC